MRFKFLFLLFFLFYATSLCAHGDLHKRIVKVTEEINEFPDSAYLYFKRGELYYQHSNFISSLKDFKYSKRLGFNSIEQRFLEASSYYHLGNFGKSKKIIKKILKEQPSKIKALQLLADLYYKKNRFKKSANLYDQVIEKSKITYPENYIYASKAWYATETIYGYKRSQSVLIEGIEKLGNIIVLYNALISNYINSQDFDSAVKYQNKVIEISTRKERAYLKLANLQIKQEKYEEAELSIIKAEASYNKLPHRLRNTKFMKEFYSELQSKKSILK